jgi:hypothetical protein
MRMVVPARGYQAVVTRFCGATITRYAYGASVPYSFKSTISPQSKTWYFRGMETPPYLICSQTLLRHNSLPTPRHTVISGQGTPHAWCGKEEPLSTEQVQLHMLMLAFKRPSCTGPGLLPCKHGCDHQGHLIGDKCPVQGSIRSMLLFRSM